MRNITRCFSSLLVWLFSLFGEVTQTKKAGPPADNCRRKSADKMSQLVLERYCYSDTVTEGKLYLNDDEYIRTLERPWRDGAPGGVPFKSCVPDGEYELLPYVRPNGDQVFALWNADLSVYLTEADRGDRQGRYLILIHSGNYVTDVVGCIAPGLDRIIHKGAPMVTNSRAAMKRIMTGGYTSLLIRTTDGAKQ